MAIETYGTEVGEEFDYDDEDDVESDVAALRKKLAEGDQEVARLNRENEKVVEELAVLEREKKELTELILRNDETIARLKAENSRTRCGIGYLPEDMARKDKEHVRLKAAIARLRTKLGFLLDHQYGKRVYISVNERDGSSITDSKQLKPGGDHIFSF
ncbi:uncharacterized protein LOC131309949 isoform X1 [Rhododendron vialii]|uniref:uncharacterized protein LOC131309949 isoform X1 n=1 Tax=Rhododendron vialii TaxID=182163 RepID=UPI00265EB65D|nr:uncharacterized protein LOC131309949 isoform X1 [Rhododendron vialii]